jgi:hypothetical protein
LADLGDLKLVSRRRQTIQGLERPESTGTAL